MTFPQGTFTPLVHAHVGRTPTAAQRPVFRRFAAPYRRVSRALALGRSEQFSIDLLLSLEWFGQLCQVAVGVGTVSSDAGFGAITRGIAMYVVEGTHQMVIEVGE